MRVHAVQHLLRPAERGSVVLGFHRRRIGINVVRVNMERERPEAHHVTPLRGAFFTPHVREGRLH